MATWSPHWQDPQGATLLPETVWFKLYQPILVRMANTTYGRELLCIDKSLPKIVEVLPHTLKCVKSTEQKYGLCRTTYVRDFRTHAKWANVIRSRWSEFNSYARYFLNEPVVASPLVRTARALVAATATFYPDPHPETNTVDGWVELGSGDGSFADLRTGEATDVSDTDEVSRLALFTGATTDIWSTLSRLIFGYNTAAIDDSETPTSAIVSLSVQAHSDVFGESIGLTSATPASNTAVILADFDISNFGSTNLCTPVDFDALTDEQYNDFTLNASGLAHISKTGVTNFAARLTSDISGVAPDWVEDNGSQADIYMADTATTDQDPKLVVTSEVIASEDSALNPAFFGGGSTGRFYLS